MSKILVLVFTFLVSPLKSMDTPKTGFQKWDSLVALKEAGLRAPYGYFVKPHSSEYEIEAGVDRFIAENASELIALRPDGINGTGQTPAGITFKKGEKEKMLNKLVEWSGKGYGVSLVETYNRFNYDFCCNVLLDDDDGNFTIEGIGPGFDGGDLNKSLLSPTFIVTNKFESPIFIYSDSLSCEADIDALQSLFLRIDISSRAPTKEEIRARLKYIATRLLPDMGIDVGSTPEAAEEWLKRNECDRLLKGENPKNVISFESLQQIVFSASRYAHSLRNKGGKINAKVLTVHGCNGKIICFGAYDGQRSFK